MPKIPIISGQKKPSVPTSKQLSVKQPRFHPSGKPPLPLNESFSPSGKKQREN